MNPFGDANLLTPFVWGKKKEVDQSKDRKSDRDRQDEEGKQLKLMTEIEKVRKRRQDREEELAEMERLRDEEVRLREISAFGDWQRKEEVFHLEQTLERAVLRILDHRERPMDQVVKNYVLTLAARRLLEFHEQHHDDSHREYELKELSKEVSLLRLSAEVRSPIDVLDRLDKDDLQRFTEELDHHMQLDAQKGGAQATFWNNFKVAVQYRQKRMQDRSLSALHESIIADVEDLLKGKSEAELNTLEDDIRSNLGPGKVIDVEYWELMLEEVVAQRAKRSVVKNHVEQLQQLVELQTAVNATGILSKLREENSRNRHGSSSSSSGSMPKEDQAAVASYLREMAQEADLDDTELKMVDSDEVLLTTTDTTYWWQDKYRPRKPRYFNRVKTGWDRNKYNLSHYDSDNPPPVRIQGYKFTIFYPDLIDKTKTPRYFIEPSPDSNEFVIIRFHAGPPYEDLAFKIVNREWDVHRRAGFLCVFDRGILQLHFNFKRAFYRR